MALGGRHKEDVKAVLRKRYGSVCAFEKAKGLPPQSVSDVLRGRSVARTQAALILELVKSDAEASLLLGVSDLESDFPDDSTAGPDRPQQACVS